MSQPFRFVHCSDLHLGRPLAGLADPPAHLVDCLLDAPYAAARRVFDLTIRERADFLVLAGDVVNLRRATPRAVAFLVDEFERLAAAGIAVYWVAGRSERRAAWPSELPLPPSVHRFAGGAPQAIVHEADGEPLVVLLGCNRVRSGGWRRGELPKSAAKLFTIGVAHGRLTDQGLGKAGVDYWVGGGSHRRRKLRLGRVPVVYSGSPQGRSPAEHGAHGAVVVAVDEHAVARPRFVATDVARYLRLRETVDLASPRGEQERLLAARLDAERARAAGIELFVSWRLRPAESAAAVAESVGAAPFSRAAFGTEMLARLRHEFGVSSPALWSISVEIEPRQAPTPHAASDGSLLADFLHEAAACDEAAIERALEAMLPDARGETSFEKLVALTSPRQRRRVLRQGVTLGSELLSGGESASR